MQRWLYRILILLLPCAPVYAEALVIGGDESMDACPTLAMVKAKRFIFLRSAPSLSAPPVGKILAGSNVYICVEKGGWLGVVVEEGGTCGVSSPILEKETYKGPCRSGWIEVRQVETVAG